jgi:hypothetical protein
MTSLPARAQAVNPVEVLCTPGIYIVDPEDCQPLGPSGFLTRMASQGITFPLRNLLSEQPDPPLAFLPYNYATLAEDVNPVYATLEDAMSGSSAVRDIPPGGLKYVSYINYQETDRGDFLSYDQVCRYQAE